MDNGLTLCGNVTGDPVLRYTRGNVPVTSFDIAVNRRWNDPATNERKEATTFCSVQVWRGMAENVAMSLKKGQRIIATGRLEQNVWENDAGVRQSQLRMVATDIGHSLMFATTEYTKVDRRNAAAIAQAPEVEGAPTERPTETAGEGGEEPF